MSVYMLAERYDVAVGTIFNWARLGKMPQGFLLGGRRLFWADEILEWEARDFTMEENQ